MTTFITMPTLPCLYIDTTSHVMQLALELVSSGDESGSTWVMRQNEHTSQRYHSAVIFPELKALFEEANISPDSLASIVVNRGPGSFTGIRTGLTVARMLAQFSPSIEAHQVFGVTTFDIIAASLASEYPGKSISIWLDALRCKAYHAELCWTEGQMMTSMAPGLKPITELHGQLDDVATQQKVIVVSHQQLLPEGISSKVIIAALDSLTLNAPQAMRSLIAQSPEVYAVVWQALQPIYLQDPNITVKKVNA